MKVDSTTQVLQVLKKVCPSDSWRGAQGYNGDVLRSEQKRPYREPCLKRSPSDLNQN